MLGNRTLRRMSGQMAEELIGEKIKYYYKKLHNL
jgi:hypothetical protein